MQHQQKQTTIQSKECTLSFTNVKQRPILNLNLHFLWGRNLNRSYLWRSITHHGTLIHLKCIISMGNVLQLPMHQHYLWFDIIKVSA